MKKVLILEDDANVNIFIDYLRKVGEDKKLFEIHHVDNLIDTIWTLEEEKEAYDALIFDIAMEGIAVNFDQGVFAAQCRHLHGKRVYLDSYYMNAYLYVKDQWETLFQSYKGKIAFFTGYSELIQSRAVQEGFSLDGIEVFEKSNRDDIYKMIRWLTEVLE
jgi:hypothetical protein